MNHKFTNAMVNVIIDDYIIAELEEIKNEMIKTKGLSEAFDYVMIINKHIEDLKG